MAAGSNLVNDVFRLMIEQSPVATALFVGKDMTLKIANDTMLIYLGKDRSIVGLPLAEGVPELVGQPFLNILDNVFTSGIAYVQKAAPADLHVNGRLSTFYFDFTYQPLLDGEGKVYAIMDVSVDVTDEVTARRQLEEEKERTSLAIELSEVGVFEVDLASSEVTTDKRFNEIFGYKDKASRHEYISRFHKDDLERRHNGLERMKETGGLDYEARLVIEGEPIRWVRTKGKLLYSQQGEAFKLIGLVQDITRQKEFEESLAEQVRERTTELQRAQQSLTRSNTYLQSVLDNFDSAFAALSPIYDNGKISDFRLVKSNTAYSSYTQMPPSESENVPLSRIFPEYFKTDAFERYVSAFETGEPDAWEMHYNVDGLDVHLQIVARRIQDEVVVQFIDFTTLKNLELELLQKIEELERSNRNLEEFAYAASHDLKEPIRKILFFTDLLHTSLRPRLSEREVHHFERMELAGKRMFSLIEDLLSYSQVNLRLPLQDSVDFNQLVSLVLGDLELDIQEKQAIIMTDPLFTLPGHSRQLQQVFHNLLSNALKYSRPGHAPLISITSTVAQGKDIPVQMSGREQGQPYHVIAVSDNGIGFEQQDAEKIFDVFTRLHGSNIASGTGVGLAIVRKAMENHKGFVRAASKPGEGTVFYLYFPISN